MSDLVVDDLVLNGDGGRRSLDQIDELLAELRRHVGDPAVDDGEADAGERQRTFAVTRCQGSHRV